eukprot:11623435-Ditylum_brightwellii.AAC.1
MVCGCSQYCVIKEVKLEISSQDEHEIHSGYFSIPVPFWGANLVLPQGKSFREPMEKREDGWALQKFWGDLVRPIIMIRRINIRIDQEITNDGPKQQSELKEIELQFYNGAEGESVTFISTGFRGAIVKRY